MTEHSISSVKKWRECRRRYRYEYVQRIRPRPGKALRIGTAWHAALEVFDVGGSLDEAIVELDRETWMFDGGQVERARTRAMLRAYWWRWAPQRSDWQTIESERWFRIPIGTSVVVGRNDALWLHVPSARKCLVERKTTSDEIETLGADYWQRLALDTQITLYPYEASRRHGSTPEILYDVVRKPSGAPRGKKKIAKRKSETPEEYEQRKAENIETLAEFEARLFETMCAAPDEYLVRRIVPRLEEENAEILDELRETLAEMDAYAGSYPRNDGACSAKYGLCPFLGVCSGTDTLASERFEHRDEEQQQQPTESNTNGSDGSIPSAKHPAPAAGDPFADCPI